MLLALLLCIALPKTSSAQRVSVVLENEIGRAHV